MDENLFHDAVDSWFRQTFDRRTPAQSEGWEPISEGRHTLIAAPTGSGKTLAAFLSALDDLVGQGLAGELEPGIQVVYVSPLKALSYDIDRNLQRPLEGINRVLEERGESPVDIRTFVRTGDTPQSARRKMVKDPPHILATTPESLYLLLTSKRGREALETTKTLIVDEIHAVAGNRRGSHLSLTMERLDELVGGGLQRIGLSATQKPIDEIARFLTGTGRGDDDAECTIVDAGHEREIDLQVEVTESPLQPVMSAEHMEEIYDRLAELIDEHRTTLIFTNTRREAERVTTNLVDRLGEGTVTSHHGSLAKERRHRAEQALKSGELDALVATASMELGIDIGFVDLVCQLGSVRAISTLLQRVGRSGHTVGAVPKGRIFPLTRDELVESAALLDAVRRGELDRLEIPPEPTDILAQQIVAMSAVDEWDVDELCDIVRRAHPYRNLDRETFESVLRMLSNGFDTKRGRRGAYIYWDEVNDVVRGRKSARITALTSGGAIPDQADFRVVIDSTETMVGTLDEDFAIESLPGDIFQLGNHSWQITRIESAAGRVRVEDAGNRPPTLPFWFGEAPSRTVELSGGVSRMREETVEQLGLGPMSEDSDDAGVGSAQREAAVDWLSEDVGLAEGASEQVVEYVGTTRVQLGATPSRDRIVAERFFDEAGNTHLVLHSPFGSRLNRAWGLALRKRFCRKFNFELQAAANEDAIVLSMGPTHSFPLDEVFDYLNPETVRHILVQALLDSPMFETRWRWNLNRSLAVPRFWGGRDVPPHIQRMQAEDMLSLVFPDQIACLENIQGEREIPDHPIVNQTIEDCLEEAMDIDELEAVLRGIADGSIDVVARDVREPSPMAQEVLNSRPYAYLDDAPLEERRTRAIRQRGMLDVETAEDLAELDPEAIDRVREQVWPDPETADELHDALVCGGFVTSLEMAEGRRENPFSESDDSDDGWLGIFGELVEQGRATTLRAGDRDLHIATERLPRFERSHPDADVDPPVDVPEAHRAEELGELEAVTEIVRDRLEVLGPTTVSGLAETSCLETSAVEGALQSLEAEGAVFRGNFDPRLDADDQWCERRLLARIHRYTLDRLRQRIKPVAPADYLRFLFDWQHVASPEHEGADDSPQVAGIEGLASVLQQLAGFHAAASAWESDILPARVEDYDPDLLDELCHSGRATWGRLRADGSGGHMAMRTTPVTVLPRSERDVWALGREDAPELSSKAERALEAFEDAGALFFDDLMRECGLLRAQLEEALDELVAAGMVTSDGFSGLRALLIPSADRRSGGNGRRRSDGPAYRVNEAGRWSRIRRREPEDRDEWLESVAWQMLRRWGVVFRKLVRHDSPAPWRKLLYVYRRMEARGEIRGGRFVSSFTGEQFALPEAVARLRSVRAADPTGEIVSVSASDPLNLTGVIDNGRRIAAKPSNRVLYRDGLPIAVLEGGEKQFLTDVDGPKRAEAERTLVRKPTPQKVLAYLGSHG